MGMLQPFQDCGAIIREIAGRVKRILDMPAMFVWYFKEENTLRFWRLCGRIEKTRRKETAVTLQQLRHVTAVAGTGTISHAVQQRCAGLYMTKQAGNRSYIHALCNQQAGVRMPQAMHIQIQWQVVCFQYQLKAIGKCSCTVEKHKAKQG